MRMYLHVSLHTLQYLGNNHTMLTDNNMNCCQWIGTETVQSADLKLNENSWSCLKQARGQLQEKDPTS